MRLARIQAWNFRSYAAVDDETPSLDLTLSPGVNYLSGVNNAGKSNILRALAFALDPSAAPYDRDIDRTKGKTWGPAVLLELHAGKTPSGPARKMLEYVDQQERAIEGFRAPSLASEGIVRLYVEQDWDKRKEWFLTRGSWAEIKRRRGGKGNEIDRTRSRAIERLRELVQYVDIKSGEDLQSLLQRRFRDSLLGAVFYEDKRAMEAAEHARTAYWHALNQMLRPIARHVQSRIQPYVRDVEEIDLVADVPTVDDALRAPRVIVKDAVETPLEHKGTGVRGAMLLLLLSFIADSARTPVIFGIEEPEAFLHPDAHRALADGLARFTQREDVTLLVTTHSPFLFRAGDDPRNTVFRVTKDEHGRSSVSKSKIEEARTDLLGSEVLASALEKVEAIPESTKLILVVEGQIDADYIRLASNALGVSLAGIHIAWQRGALAVLLQSLALAAQHAPARRVMALFDNDASGKPFFELLYGRFGWQHKASDGLFVSHYEKWRPNGGNSMEAEDIFEDKVVKRFLDEPGNMVFLTGSKLLNKNQNRWHYDLDRDGKTAFVRWLEQHGTPEIFEPWQPLLEHLASLVKGAAK